MNSVTTVRPGRAAWVGGTHPVVVHGPPQLWELGDLSDPAGDAEMAADLAAAAWGDHDLADRLRGARGRDIRVQAAAITVTGVVADVMRDAVLLSAADADWLLRLDAVRRIVAPPCDPCPPAGRQRAGGLAALRSRCPDGVILGLVDGSTETARLLGVGADHLTLAVPGGWAHVPWTAVAWVRI